VPFPRVREPDRHGVIAGVSAGRESGEGWRPVMFSLHPPPHGTRTGEQSEAFRDRDLSGVELDYLYLDSSHFKMHDGSRAEPVLVAYGITTVGRPVLLAVEPGGDESHDAWAGFLDDLKDRGLRSPLLVISGGAPGLLGAIEVKLPTALRRRCLIHRARNVAAKVPAERRDELKAAFWELFDLPDGTEPG